MILSSQAEQSLLQAKMRTIPSIEHCPKEAIAMSLGAGITVDAPSCDGCGGCTGYCPAEPKAIELNSRQDV